MARIDALFADPVANASIYTAILADPVARLSPEFLRALFDAHDPDPVPGGASVDDVIAHLFEHILGPASWWGSSAASWQGEELLAAGYRDAVERAQSLGNVPIRTFHSQAASDGRLQVQVLDAGSVVVVIIATPRVPLGPRPRDYKLVASEQASFGPRDDRMPEVSSYTIETMRG